MMGIDLLIGGEMKSLDNLHSAYELYEIRYQLFEVGDIEQLIKYFEKVLFRIFLF